VSSHVDKTLGSEKLRDTNIWFDIRVQPITNILFDIGCKLRSSGSRNIKYYTMVELIYVEVAFHFCYDKM